MKAIVMKALAALFTADYLIGSAALLAWKRDLLSVCIVVTFGAALVVMGIRKRRTLVKSANK